MPWFLWYLLHLAFTGVFSKEVNIKRLNDIYWNATNPM